MGSLKPTKVSCRAMLSDSGTDITCQLGRSGETFWIRLCSEKWQLALLAVSFGFTNVLPRHPIKSSSLSAPSAAIGIKQALDLEVRKDGSK